MSELSFDSVDVLIYDPVPANRNATRASMLSLGFRRTETVPTLEDFVRGVRTAPPDIALCEAQGAAEELCTIIRQMRQDGASYNPFIVIIVSAWEKNGALINRIVSSGADDLLLRPFSTALLGQRIETLVHRRKGFVITADYVGPDRRLDTSRTSNVELFEPPNSLKMKAKDKLSSEALTRKLDAELKSARETLIAEKLRRDSFQVCILWRLLETQPLLPGAPPPDLIKLQLLAKSIEVRSRDSEFAAAVTWCQSVLASAEGLAEGLGCKASLHLLGHAALSLNQVFNPDTSAAKQLTKIDAIVALSRARGQAKALAS
jgi:DNA-binding response OmpR family regulator